MIRTAQYEADRAERQFMLADPENRLVVRSLESNWNQKLKELEKAKQDYAIYNSKKSLDPLRKRRTGHSGSRTKDSGDLERTNIYAKRKEAMMSLSWLKNDVLIFQSAFGSAAGNANIFL